MENEIVYNQFLTLKDIIGEEKLAEEMFRALTTEQAADIIKYIARAYDVEF